MEAKIEKIIGSSVHDCGSSIKLHNATMKTGILKEYRMEDCKAVETPVFQDLDRATEKSEKLTHGTPYRQLIGSPLHLAGSVRPDIAFAVVYFWRLMHKPTKML